MKSAAACAVVLVTAPNKKTARKLARGAVQRRLAACANLIPRLDSYFRWSGKVDVATEVLLIFKTVRTQVSELERYIVEEHPYDTPEFLVLPVSGGNARYLRWLTDSTEEKPGARKRKRRPH